MSRLLVADDEEGLLEMIRFSLEAAGHTVTAVKNGRVALETAKREKFDLVILDVMMPFMDGYHASAEITQLDNPPPVLLLTSRDYDQDQAAIKGSGASAFLNKPFEVSSLLQVVGELLAGR